MKKKQPKNVEIGIHGEVLNKNPKAVTLINICIFLSLLSTDFQTAEDIQKVILNIST